MGGDQTIRAPWPIVEHYVFINDFNRFVYDYSIHRGRKYFFRYCFYAFITEEILELHIKYWFKINGKQTNKRPKKGEYVKLKNYERKRKSPFMIYADFESIVVPEDNGKQNSNESYTNKYQKHVACSYRYKLVCVDDKLSKPFKSFISENAVYNFISSIYDRRK